MKAVELLLKKDMSKLGARGNIVKVKAGYARNYLIPKGLAVVATKENMRLLEIEKKKSLQEEANKVEKLKERAKELESTPCTIEAKANEENHLFGSVTYAMIADAFKDMGFGNIKAEDLELEDSSLYPIKEVGIFPVFIQLHSEVKAKSKVWVVDERDSE